MLEVIRKHRGRPERHHANRVPEQLVEEAEQVWRDAYALGHDYGYRNAQVTVLAPTGTIGFMMDCDTTGIEPDLALVKYKKLVDGGSMKIINNTVPDALERLGYNDEEISDVLQHIQTRRPSRARRTCRRNTCRSSTAPSARPTANARSSTWGTCA